MKKKSAKKKVVGKSKIKSKPKLVLKRREPSKEKKPKTDSLFLCRSAECASTGWLDLPKFQRHLVERHGMDRHTSEHPVQRVQTLHIDGKDFYQNSYDCLIKCKGKLVPFSNVTTTERSKGDIMRQI